MALKSRKALAAALVEIGHLPAGYDYKNLSNEVYGRDAHIYFDAKDRAARKEIEGKLEDRGFKVHRSYCPEGPTVDVSVSYFKGWHWDE